MPRMVCLADSCFDYEGKTLSEDKISLEDRQEIYDTLARYVWSMDTGDIAGVVATFTPDGVVRCYREKMGPGGGRRQGIRHAFSHPSQPPGWTASRAASVRRESRWRRLLRHLILGLHQMGHGGDNKSIRTMGSYADTCVKVDGKWLIKDKIIDPWPRHGPNSRDPGIGPCHGCLGEPGTYPHSSVLYHRVHVDFDENTGARKTIHNQAGPYRKHPLRACPTT